MATRRQKRKRRARRRQENNANRGTTTRQIGRSATWGTGPSLPPGWRKNMVWEEVEVDHMNPSRMDKFWSWMARAAAKIVFLPIIGGLWVLSWLLKGWGKIAPRCLKPMFMWDPEHWPKQYQWDTYPALQSFMDWEYRPAMEQWEDEESGLERPKCFATTTKRIRDTIGHSRGKSDHNIDKGVTVEICIASSMGDLCIREHNEKRIGLGCYGYTQRVLEEDLALIDFREQP